MPKHIPPHDNHNEPIVDLHDATTPLAYFNDVRLKKGETFAYQLEEYESVNVMATGTCSFDVDGNRFDNVGQRQHLWEGKPDSVYAPLNSKVTMTCVSNAAEIFIAGGQCEPRHHPFRVSPDEVDKVQYGSDETKTHRKILHVLGQKQRDRTGRLLVSELFTVGAGGWSGFPPHKHDEDREGEQTAFQEIYHFRFNPDHGFGAQFAYPTPDSFEPVYRIKSGSTVLLDGGYHPSVAAPGYEMYYFTVLVGRTSHSLVQFFEPDHAYQVHTIPGILDIINKIRIVTMQFAHGFHTQPVEHNDPGAKWRVSPAVSGPTYVLGDIGTHAFYLGELISGLKVERLACMRQSFVASRAPLEDNAHVMLQFEGGAVGTLWASAVNAGSMHQQRIRVVGSRASIEWWDEHPNQLRYEAQGEPARVIDRGMPYLYRDNPAVGADRIGGGHAEGFFESWANLYHRFALAMDATERDDQGALAGLWYPDIDAGIAGVRLCEKCVESADDGAKWVAFQD